MSDTRPTGPDRDRQQRFEDALDDLFGSDEPEPPATAARPIERQASVSTGPANNRAYSPQPSYPIPTESASRQRGRSVGRTIGISCAVVVGIIFVCITALAIVGFIAGDDTGASSQRDTTVSALAQIGQSPH